MQETGQSIGSRQREHEVHIYPVGVNKFFSEDDFREAGSWDAGKLGEESERLSDTTTTYSPNANGIPMPIAQMAFYVYESLRLARDGRTKESMELSLDRLSEHGLKNVLAFCGQAISHLPGVDNLGNLARIVDHRFKNQAYEDEYKK